MARYPAFLDGKEGAYGVTFPDLPGIVAMGESVDDALWNAEEALRGCDGNRSGWCASGRGEPDQRVSPPEGASLITIPPNSPLRPQHVRVTKASRGTNVAVRLRIGPLTRC